MRELNIPSKWRPSLALLIAGVVLILLLLPFAALIGARVTSNQFVRETEANLHAQAAIYAELYAAAIDQTARDSGIGQPIPPALAEHLGKPWHPVETSLSARRSRIEPPRPDPIQGGEPEFLDSFSALAERARRTTLVGFLALDHQGFIVAASGTDRGSLAHVDEVARALRGEIVSVARWRVEEYRNHSLRSLSRDTKFRVYVAHPVVVGDRVVGAVYLSRTPSNLNKYLFQQRHVFSWLFGGMVLAAALIGWFFWRFLTRPLQGLGNQARGIADGAAITRLPHYGLKELARLGQSLIDMGAALRRKSDSLETYTKHATHELKSPVTSIMGAAELLENPKVSDDRRVKLARTIKSDAARMDRLLLSMREMVRGQNLHASEATTLTVLIDELRAAHEGLEIAGAGAVDATLPLSQDAARICLKHLVENAAQHGATRVEISFDPDARRIEVHDNGEGISAANRDKVTDAFFTTKREQGGTGMGLSICAEVAAQFGGEVQVMDAKSGTLIALVFAPD
jgi:signal transduction histidine kinase